MPAANRPHRHVATGQPKGHWPRGRRRNDCAPDLLRDTLRVLRWQLRTGGTTRRAAAARIGVSDRTIRRWLAGEDWPPQRTLQRLARWLEQVRESRW